MSSTTLNLRTHLIYPNWHMKSHNGSMSIGSMNWSQAPDALATYFNKIFKRFLKLKFLT